MPSFYEFFAGGGMVRAGLSPAWDCLFANDCDPRKSRSYRENWGGAELKTADIASLTTRDLPGVAGLAWASFPCQDLSLAGDGAGLKGNRSGAFWPFWRLMRGLVEEDRAPRIVVLENVCGALTSHGGKDFAAICNVLQDAGYRYGAVVVDAALFVPQSRPRLFIVAVHGCAEIPRRCVADGPVNLWHGKITTPGSMLWWNPPVPPRRTTTLFDVIEENVEWFSKQYTQQLLTMMSDVNRVKIQQAMRGKQRVVGTLYRRTRKGVQRAEVRFDGVSGCLRTPAGGSSRQVVVVVDGASVRARLISSRETARLMGLPDSYKLPQNYNEAYHLTGDGVVVPVVRYLAEHIFEPVLKAKKSRTIAA